MKKLIRRCFDCIHIQPHRSGDHFDTICDKTGKPTDPSAVCENFMPQYVIKSRFLRKMFRGVDSPLTPRSEKGEILALEMFGKIKNIIDTYARKTAKRMISKIGKD